MNFPADEEREITKSGVDQIQKMAEDFIKPRFSFFIDFDEDPSSFYRIRSTNT